MNTGEAATPAWLLAASNFWRPLSLVLQRSPKKVEQGVCSQTASRLQHVFDRRNCMPYKARFLRLTTVQAYQCFRSSFEMFACCKRANLQRFCMHLNDSLLAGWFGSTGAVRVRLYCMLMRPAASAMDFQASFVRVAYACRQRTRCSRLQIAPKSQSPLASSFAMRFSSVWCVRAGACGSAEDLHPDTYLRLRHKASCLGMNT